MKTETRPAYDSKQTGTGEQHPVVDELRRLLAEMIGTFALTMVAAGGEVIAVVSGGEVSHAARMVAPGLLVMAMTYTLANLSGAHFNPVVTLAFTLRQDFPWKRVPGYWLAQFTGAILAALLLRLLFGPVAKLGASSPHFGMVDALVMEIVLSFILVTVILGTATNHRLTGHNAAIAVGGTIALAGLFAGPISGASMNPARSIGPMLASGQLADAWIYILGPLAGMLLAVAAAWLLRGKTTPEAVETAKGD